MSAHTPPPPPQFTDDEARELKGMARDYQNSKWIGRLFWRVAVLVGSVVAGLAVFKEHLHSIFKGN